MTEKIQVTKTFLPPYEEYEKYIRKIWATGWITNNGELSRELERKLAEYLGVKHLLLVSNGTIALQILYQALGLSGEVITTPFSYVATTSTLVWEKLKPVFADIDPGTYCLDPDKVEEQITEKTSAILATHVYGNPCEVERLQAIADKHKLRLIYDAAHAFGVKWKGSSVLNYGDASTLSFHATKLFHTIEGGAIITDDDELARTCEHMRRFSHDGPYAFHAAGINGKITEFQAAMGLCILPSMDAIIGKRREITLRYQSLLEGSGLVFQQIAPGCTEYNYAYVPVLFPDTETLKRAEMNLAKIGITGRRYFFPSLNTLDFLEGPLQQMPVSEDIASRVFCLPLYPELSLEDADHIAATVQASLKSIAG